MITKRILVAYASKRGSTAEIAQVVGQELAQEGLAIEVQPIENITDLSPYAAVVIGSAIRFGAWLPVASEFLKQNQEALSRIPTATFTVCATLHEDTPETRAEAESYLKPIHEVLKPEAEILLAGRVDPALLRWWERLIVNMVGAPKGDFRDWKLIRGWAGNLRESLLAA